MSQLTMDLNSLAQETLELSQNLRKKLIEESREGEMDFFSFQNFDGLEDSEEGLIDFSSEEDTREENVFEDVPEASGVLYRVDKGTSTFCIRGIVSEDLQWDWEKVEKEDSKLASLLKIHEEEQWQEVRFFVTHDTGLSETLVDQMVNRRFPRHEAMLCNLSDPGFSWWMDFGAQDLQIYFQSHGVERDSSFTQLGPLGDPLIAFRRLSRALTYLKQYFPVSEYSATDKAFMISTNREGNEAFRAFQDIFIHGHFPWEEFLKKTRGEEQTLLLYLKEMAHLRKFWINIESYL